MKFSGVLPYYPARPSSVKRKATSFCVYAPLTPYILWWTSRDEGGFGTVTLLKVPYVTNAGAKIYWNEQGSGPPVLLIMGLSFTHEMWFRVLPILRTSYRAIYFRQPRDGPQRRAARSLSP